MLLYSRDNYVAGARRCALAGVVRKAPYMVPVVKPFVVLDEFLAAEELRALLNYTRKNERRFRPSEVLDSDDNSTLDRHYRRSCVLFDLGPFELLFSRRLLTFLPYVLGALVLRVL